MIMRIAFFLRHGEQNIPQCNFFYVIETNSVYHFCQLTLQEMYYKDVSKTLTKKRRVRVLHERKAWKCFVTLR